MQILKIISSSTQLVRSLATSVALVFALLAGQLAFVVSYRFARSRYDRVVTYVNFWLINVLKISRANFSIDIESAAQLKPPVIIVSNHQSLHDIPLIIFGLAQLGPRFVAKQELGKFLPCISHALRNQGSALIDRSSAMASARAVRRFGAWANTARVSPVIFPEGARSQDGLLRKFHALGLAALLETLPDAPILPVLIQNTWQITRHRFLPIPPGLKLSLTTLKPIFRNGLTREQALAEIDRAFEGRLPRFEDC